MESTDVSESKEKNIVTKFQKLTKIEKTSFFYGLIMLILFTWVPLIIGYYSLTERRLEFIINLVILLMAIAGIIIGLISLNIENNSFTLIGFLSSIIATVLTAWFMIVYQYIVYL